MIKNIFILFACAVFLAMHCPAGAVDALTGITGMIDSNYYKYEVRGQSAVSLRLSQSLWEGGATAARVAMSRARLSSSKHLLADAAASLVFDAIAAHVNVLRQKELVALATQNIADYNEIIEMLRSRVSSGLSTEADISLVESRLFRAHGSLAEYQSELAAAAANFEMVTGRPLPLTLARVMPPKKTYKNADMVMQACLDRNPRLLAQHDGTKEAEGREKLAASANFPAIAIEAGPRWNVQNTPQDSRNHGVDAFLTFQWNLYQGGATKAAMKQAAAQKRQAMQNTRQTADTLKADIFGTWAQYQGAAERMNYYNKSMETATKARAVFYEQYLLGAKSLLDLLDADNEYFVAAAGHAVASADRIIGAYRLLALAGDILAEMKVEPPAGEKTGKRN